MQLRRWVLLADERISRLFRIDRTEVGAISARIQNEIHDGEAGTRFRMDGQRSVKAADAHDNDARLVRFAAETAVWLEQEIERRQILHGVTVLAPAPFIDALRKSWSARLALRVSEHQSDVAHLSPAEVVKHPVVVRLMEGAGTD